MEAMLKVRRFRFPHPSVVDAKLEPIMQPLYSAGVLDNAALGTQRELRFFGYAIGQVVSGLAAAAGTVASSVIHTNMDTPGFLAAPKVFLASGVRVVFPNIDSALTALLDDSTTAAEFPTAHSLTDLLEILYGTFFRFFVGTKSYLEVPTWAVPGNTGVGGVVETSIMTPAAAGPFEAQIVSANTAGKYFGCGESQILIPHQQNFHCAIIAPHATPPTIAQERIIYTVLDGVLGREVQ